ncbi:protein-tyrosine phosphatase [Paenibacillus sp. UNCCL117]|uniref:tyrosine-protein phosphatase n=1 Tax=unclassified Paenibacillus TaxID=185978 RepID=UPI00088E3458|nr:MULTISPECIES: CpsB/CapC family capsule biosynthesis tyrosine phosphatase [unclassified Paenibacillus]SDC18568.1 protein-tyrosine phosphatase [Paenibacillus sp. cl123]SFW18229.1 protein-tyrosine phosphatase [Paenibacillus sp. UNCCL117]
MIDIHCHLLDGIDDGAKTFEESVEMARLAYDDGVRHIIATPHFCNKFMTDKSVQLKKIEQLQRELDREGIAVTVHPGSEVRLESAAYVYDHAEQDRFFYLDAARRFILLEQRWGEYSPDTEQVVKWFLDQGTTPIIPHPERHPFFRDNPELLTNLISLGAWVQVTADSLVGKNGAEAESFGRWLLARNHVHLLATDAHSTVRRSNLTEGLRVVREAAGEERVQAIISRINSILAG